MSTTITRTEYPHLWSVLALVAATMDQSPVDQVADVGVAELASYELDLSSWDFAEALILAGVVSDDVRFDELVSTEVGSFVNHLLSMP